MASINLEQTNADVLYRGVVLDPRDRVKGAKQDVRQNPLYYIEVLTRPNTDISMAYVYELNPLELSEYRKGGYKFDDLQKLDKAYTQVRKIEDPKLMGGTTLGNALYQSKKSKVVHKTVYSKPVFVTPLFESDDSFTGNREIGFAEYTKATTAYKSVNGKNKVVNIPPQLTGVFIGFSNIFIIDKVMPKDEVLTTLLSEGEQTLMAIDMTGQL